MPAFVLDKVKNPLLIISPLEATLFSSAYFFTVILSAVTRSASKSKSPSPFMTVFDAGSATNKRQPA